MKKGSRGKMPEVERNRIRETGLSNKRKGELERLEDLAILKLCEK